MPKFWFFWHVYDPTGGMRTMGPYQLTDLDAGELQHRTMLRYPGFYYRWIYDGLAPLWRFDDRSQPEILSGVPARRPARSA